MLWHVDPYGDTIFNACRLGRSSVSWLPCVFDT
jgi:hypothetical protein